MVGLHGKLQRIFRWLFWIFLSHDSRPLLAAVINDRMLVVCCLLSAKADQNARNVQGFTALTAGANNGHADVVRCLLDARRVFSLQFGDETSGCGAATAFQLHVSFQ